MADRMIKNSSSLMVKLSIHQTPAPVSAPASPFFEQAVMLEKLQQVRPHKIQ